MTIDSAEGTTWYLKGVVENVLYSPGMNFMQKNAPAVMRHSGGGYFTVYILSIEPVLPELEPFRIVSQDYRWPLSLPNS